MNDVKREYEQKILYLQWSWEYKFSWELLKYGFERRIEENKILENLFLEILLICIPKLLTSHLISHNNCK